MHADGALEPNDASALEQHLATCERCSARVAMLRAESNAIAASLAADPITVAVPAFVRPVTLGTLAIGTGATLFVAAVLSGVQWMLGTSLPDVVRWFNPFDTSGVANMLLRAGVFLNERGDVLIASIAETALIAAILMLLAWGAFALRARARGPMVVAGLLCGLALYPTPSEAVDFRRADEGNVFVAADETVDDTLIAFGETVEVNGHVSGDLIAFARRVILRGKVDGIVITGGETVTLGGTVEGTVMAGAETLSVESAQFGRNLFGAGEIVTVGADSSIEQNVLAAGEKVSLAGTIGGDVFGAAEAVEVASTIGKALTTVSGRLTLLAPARITGDVTAHVEKDEDVVVSPGAEIGGELVKKIGEMPTEKNKYTDSGFYFSELLWLMAAFVTGIGLLALVPGLRRVSIRDGADALRTSALGLVALVATPIIALLVCFTVIGLPLGLIGFALWCAAIYLSKIVVAQLIGTHFIEAMAQTRKHYTVALLFGLLVLALLTNLPFIGGFVGFLVTIAGMGLLVSFLRDEVKPRRVADDYASRV
jgi:hypothetical protein